MERGENRSVLSEHVYDLLREYAEIGKIIDSGVAGRARHTGEVHLRIWNRVAAVRLVSSVLRDEVHEVLGRDFGDRHQAAEIHQQRAIALQDDDALVRPAERETEPMRGIEAHRADRRVIEGARRDLDPVHRGAVGRDHPLIGDVTRQGAKTFIALHHSGLRAIKNATGCESR